MIANRYGDKIAGHISRDGTAIHAREKAAPKETPKETTPKKRGRRPKGESCPPPEPTRLQQQLGRSLEENLADLPRDCDWGCKKNSQGTGECWCGYKLHIDSIDGDLPVSWLVTSASMHDSQAAIPLAQMSAGRVAIIDHNPRGGEKREFSPAEAVRYRERSTAERVNSHLHDSHGGRHVRVRGAVKVAAHLSFGLLAIAAEQLITMIC